MNVELISKTRKRIEKDYKHFNMNWFGFGFTPKIKKAWDSQYNKLSCGTVGCFAGHVIIEVLGPNALLKINDMNKVDKVAQNLLDISDVDRIKLFYIGRGSIYTEMGSRKPGTKAYASYVVTTIRQHFKDEHGVVV